MFESTEFELYLEIMEISRLANFNMDLAIEVRKRIMQLDFLYRIIDEKHPRFMELNWREFRHLEALRKDNPDGRIVTKRSEDHAEMDKLLFEIETFTESFYYLAGRMRTILRHGSRPLPGLQSFESVGARNVRNHLLEHAEGQSSRVLSQSFGVGGEQGPTIKIEREEGQEDVFPDAGLEANAREIAENLERILDRVLTFHEPGGP